ncbi:OpgC domain-containing protein [Acetobacter sp. TBRC 12305]|uniref:OpgC domain-containing protein n=1 Tax=Acetobacter garciniae TaxID=2817435 RepID=A0A939HMB9_9PROT|nr:OpgC domain-containing protein [Acetobacter garciniae]MBO1324711.1 OpgC domain-containing protein [Acetobacter garciniae]MBX0344402.1 OpgC domain-containing protein [Acetobacter garciniae]
MTAHKQDRQATTAPRDRGAGGSLRGGLAATAQALAAKGRDHRIDALRGVALLMMFIDHIPQDLLNRFTMRNVGFADAAEVFVLLAGYASWLAYGRGFEKYGVVVTLKRLFRRCVQLYIGQTIMVAVYVFTIRIWRHFTPVSVDYLEPELAHGMSWVWRVMMFDALPSNLNILPLYIVLLAGFPVFYLLVRAQHSLALLLAGALWLLVNLDPALNFPNWLDPDGWYFNPLAWQFLFALGLSASAEAQRHGGNFPHRTWLVVLCWGYLGFSALQAFPWVLWGLPDLRPFGDAVAPAKTWLSPLRLLDVVAIFYLVQSSVAARRWSAESGIGQALACVGRHSLEVFVVGTVLDLYARLIFSTFGESWLLQVGVNVVGLAILFSVAFWLDRRRNVRVRAPRTPGAPAV